MSYLMSGAGLDELGEEVIKDYLGDREVKSVDIEDFITSYLGLPVLYETIAEEDEGKIGFISDGNTPIWISQRGVPVQKIYPESTIVIDQYLQQESEKSRKRFTLAHEAGHYLLNLLGTPKRASGFSQMFDKERNYSQEDLARQFSIEEANADRLAANLLMPSFLVKQALEVWNEGKPVIVYGESVIPYDSRMKIRGMAFRLGVSYSALMIRLRRFGMIEHRDLTGYIHEEIRGRRCLG